MTRNNSTALRRGVAAAIFGAGLAVAAPAAIAYADDIDYYGTGNSVDTLTLFNGSSFTTYTTDSNAYFQVDETTGKTTPEFNSTPQTPVTTNLPSGESEYGYSNQVSQYNFFGDTQNESTATSAIAFGSLGNEFDPYSTSTIALPNFPDPTPGDLFPF